MKYYAFLSENRTDKITEEQFYQLLNKNCSNFLRTNTTLYRGMKKHFAYGYVDPTKHIRKSKNTSNYYTILFDEILPSWKNWPKRSKSVICSTSITEARAYGIIYRVYPFNDSKIGMTSYQDIWWSMQGNGFPHDLDGLNSALINLSIVFNYDLREDKQSILGLFKKIDQYNITYVVDKLKEKYNKLSIDLVSKKGNKSMIEHLSNIFDPFQNNFKLYNSSNYKHHADREVFIEGKCLMIYNQLEDDKELHNKANDAVKLLLGK